MTFADKWLWQGSNNDASLPKVASSLLKVASVHCAVLFPKKSFSYLSYLLSMSVVILLTFPNCFYFSGVNVYFLMQVLEKKKMAKKMDNSKNVYSKCTSLFSVHCHSASCSVAGFRRKQRREGRKSKS